MPALKHELGPAAARRLADELAGAWPEFPRRRFVHGLAAALEPLELVARVDLLAQRLAEVMPVSFPSAADVLWRALDSPTFTGWMTWPCGIFVARGGIDDPELALPVLAGLTPRWSSEVPIRAFLEHHPAVTDRYLREWTLHADEHVRRLVSEGTRPRLPWAPRVRRLIVDPSANVPLLDDLVDDVSPYVRRSVANHLNDISKDHPELALELARRWQVRGDGAAWVVRHGLRTLVKQGDAAALTMLGATTTADVRLVDLSVDQARLPIGGTVTLAITVALADDERQSADAVVDYRVHYVGVRDVKAPKVFKLTRRRLEPGRPVTLTRRHAFGHVSIRHIHPGPHVIDIQVNGRVLGSITIHVTPT